MKVLECASSAPSFVMKPVGSAPSLIQRWLGAWSLLALLWSSALGGCAPTTSTHSNQSTQEPANAMAVDAVMDDVMAGGQAGDGGHSDAGDDSGLENAAGMEADPQPVGPPTGVPRAPGPAPEGFDCGAQFQNPGRRSPVPLDCVLDPQCELPMVVAHRGAGGQFGAIAPENSLASIRAALLMGVDGVELDVRHTMDDRLVVIHDSTVDRTTMGTGNIDQMTLEEVTALQVVNSPLHQVPGDFECERVPTLEEAFALTAGRLFVDLDTKTHRVDLVVAAIRAAGLVDEVFVSVGDAARALEARQLDAEIRIQIRPDTPEELMADLALFQRPPEIVEIPSDQIEAMGPMITELGLKVFADVFGEDARALIVEDLSVYQLRYDQGAHILQSELPSLVLQALDRDF